jgi:NADH dehydrogenase [ubiquinone] 1 alpha subcomplex assembly factor 7
MTGAASNLSAYLRERIMNKGPLTVAEYMVDALGHPTWGYYNTRDPFGTAGDFITAPEVHQIFGELIGLWSAAIWQSFGKPKNIRLIECGPGRGTLMNDALRALRQTMPDFYAAVHVDLLEISPVLKAQQKAVLSGHHESVAVHWYENFTEIPNGPSIIITNEFFDALPIHQYERLADGWHERLVGLTDEATFCFQHGKLLNEDSFIPVSLRHAPVGDVFETSPARETMVLEIGERLQSAQGACLVIDYGYVRQGVGDTLQAVQAQEYHDVLVSPGEADITAHVDFEALSSAAKDAGCEVYGPVSQKLFLERLGIGTRAERLAAGATANQIQDIHQAVLRLVGDEEMGSLFKVMAFADTANFSNKPLPGFE